MPESNDSRLARIEEKLDRLADAMISLARAEEKLVNMEDKYNNQFARMNKFSEKLDRIETQVLDNASTVNMINKLFWVAIVAVSGAIAAQIWM
jgi:predicted  nucleic acid-binding Zn-ribbon protein